MDTQKCYNCHNLFVDSEQVYVMKKWARGRVVCMAVPVDIIVCADCFEDLVVTKKHAGPFDDPDEVQDAAHH